MLLQSISILRSAKIDLITQLWHTKSHRRQLALLRAREKESRWRRIAWLVAEKLLTAATYQTCQEEQCTISYQTNLNSRSGFDLSEFTGKILSQPNLQQLLSLCSMTVEKQICPSGIWFMDQFLQRIRLPLILLLWLHESTGRLVVKSVFCHIKIWTSEVEEIAQMF